MAETKEKDSCKEHAIGDWEDVAFANPRIADYQKERSRCKGDGILGNHFHSDPTAMSFGSVAPGVQVKHSTTRLLSEEVPFPKKPRSTPKRNTATSITIDRTASFNRSFWISFISNKQTKC